MDHLVDSCLACLLMHLQMCNSICLIDSAHLTEGSLEWWSLLGKQLLREHKKHAFIRFWTYCDWSDKSAECFAGLNLNFINACLRIRFRGFDQWSLGPWDTSRHLIFLNMILSSFRCHESFVRKTSNLFIRKKRIATDGHICSVWFRLSTYSP